MQANRRWKYRDARTEALAHANFKKNLEFIVAAKGTNPYVLVCRQLISLQPLHTC